MQVHAQEHHTAAASAQKSAAQQQVIPGDVASLETLNLPESDLPPGIPTLNLTKVAPLLPLVGGLNASVVASWVSVVELAPPETLALAVPALNNLSASTMEAVLAALPWLEWETVLAILPAVNAIPADSLTKYIKLLQDVSELPPACWHKVHQPGLDVPCLDGRLPAVCACDVCVVRRVPASWQPPSKRLPSYLLCGALPDRLPAPLLQISPDWLARLMPAVAQLDPDWLAKVIPAVLKALDPEWVVRLVNAISPGLNKVNPDLIVGLLPLVNTISLETWTKLIELLNALTIPQVGGWGGGQGAGWLDVGCIGLCVCQLVGGESVMRPRRWGTK